jgi:hypothetical protein
VPGRTLTERALVDEVDHLAPRLLGRARATLQQALHSATTALTRGIDHRYAAATGGLASALTRAETLAAQTGEHADHQSARLQRHAATLRRLIAVLHDTATDPPGPGLSTRDDTRPACQADRWPDHLTKETPR